MMPPRPPWFTVGMLLVSKFQNICHYGLLYIDNVPEVNMIWMYVETNSAAPLVHLFLSCFSRHLLVQIAAGSTLKCQSHYLKLQGLGMCFVPICLCRQSLGRQNLWSPADHSALLFLYWPYGFTSCKYAEKYKSCKSFLKLLYIFRCICLVNCFNWKAKGSIPSDFTSKIRISTIDFSVRDVKRLFMEQGLEFLWARIYELMQGGVGWSRPCSFSYTYSFL